MKRTIVINNGCDDMLREKYEFESREMVKLQEKMAKVVEEAKIRKEKKKQSQLDFENMLKQRYAL